MLWAGANRASAISEGGARRIIGRVRVARKGGAECRERAAPQRAPARLRCLRQVVRTRAGASATRELSPPLSAAPGTHASLSQGPRSGWFRAFRRPARSALKPSLRPASSRHGLCGRLGGLLRAQADRRGGRDHQLLQRLCATALRPPYTRWPRPSPRRPPRPVPIQMCATRPTRWRARWLNIQIWRRGAQSSSRCFPHHWQRSSKCLFTCGRTPGGLSSESSLAFPRACRGWTAGS